MNYEYQYLLQQIKSIANKEHVVSSNRAKSAEEITNGSLSVVVDIIQKYFAFKCSGLSEPIYIDPIGQRILNIKYINGIDVEELIGGITNGYGITIEEQPGGVYKVSVVDNMFALQEDVDDITSKFDEYTTTEDLEGNYYNKTDTDDTFLKKNGSNTYEGTLTINNSTTTNTFLKPFRVLNSDMLSNSNIAICVGKSLSAECCAYFYYTEPCTGVLGLAGYTNIINYNKSTINLNKPTTITGNLAVQNGEINMLNSNLTENSVNRIAVGKALTNDKCSYIGYKDPGIGYLGVFGNALIITWTKDLIKLEKPTTITGNLTVSGSIINNELNNRLTTIESMFKYNQTIVEENIGETLTEYLSSKDKTYGIVLANPANKSYTYVMFQSLINSGFILRCNGTSSIAFKFYGSNASLQPYKVDWITLCNKSDLDSYYTKTECDNKYVLKGEGISTKQITKQIFKNSLTLSNIEYDEELFDSSGWVLYDDSTSKTSNFTYNDGTITLSDEWSIYNDHLLIFLWSNSDSTTIEVILHEHSVNANGKNLSTSSTIKFTESDGTPYTYPITTSSQFSLTIKNVTETTIPNNELKWIIYSDHTKRGTWLMGLFRRLECIRPNEGYYTDVECDNKYEVKSWRNYYTGFVRCNQESINTLFGYMYNQTTKELTVANQNSNTYEYLGVLHDKANKQHFIRFSRMYKTCLLDEIYDLGQYKVINTHPTITDGTLYYNNNIILNMDSTNDLVSFDEIYIRISYASVPSNTTITHYVTIDKTDNINNFRVGYPVFMTGYVYKQQGNQWIPSSINDTTDCICSVKHTGTCNEYVGIVVSIDEPNNCITFASHGDYLFHVNNSNEYQLGDTVTYEGKIIDEDTPITLKVQQSIIGKATGIINNNTISVFKD